MPAKVSCIYIKLGYLKATVEYAMQHRALREEFSTYLLRYLLTGEREVGGGSTDKARCGLEV